MSQSQPAGPVFPDDVVKERNWARMLENAFGVSAEDFEGDDTWNAAITWNTALLIQALSGAGITPPDVTVEIDEIRPQVEVPDDVQFQLDVEEGVEDAQRSELRRQVYDVNVTGSTDNVLTQKIRPVGETHSFRVQVTLDTSTAFQLRIDPDGESTFTTQFNNNTDLESDNLYEFDFDVAQDAQYNFRCGAACTVTQLRVVEYSQAT